MTHVEAGKADVVTAKAFVLEDARHWHQGGSLDAAPVTLLVIDLRRKRK
ncbi:hypothetical protein [Bradyrhizobium sp. USDA 4353]